MQGRLPLGYVLCRLEDPKAQQHVLDLTLTATEGPRWAKVLQATSEFLVDAPIRANIGDRVLVKQYTGYDVRLVLPDTPQTMRCGLCNALQDDPETPPACLRNPDVLDGYGHHLFVPKATPEPLMIVDLRDVLYCEPKAEPVWRPVSDETEKRSGFELSRQ